MDVLDLPSEVQEHIFAAKQMKESVSEPGDVRDILPLIDVRRDDMPVALITCPEVNRDAALQACSMAIPGWAADHVVLFLDTLTVDPAFQEKFGRMPYAGEMQELKDSGRAYEMSLVTDAISIIEFWRDGRRRFTNIPYYVHDESGTIHWVDDKGWCYDEGVDKETKAGGLVLDYLEEFFSKPVVTTDTLPIKYEMFDISAEQARIHIDLALVRVLTEAGYAVMFACPTELHEELLKNTAENHPGLQLMDNDGEVIVDSREPEPDEIPMLLSGQLLRHRLEQEREESRANMLASRREDEAERGAAILKHLEEEGE